MKKLLTILFFLPLIIQAQFGAGIAQFTAETAPKFGVLVFGSFTSPQRANISKNLGCKYVRHSIVMNVWTGSSPLAVTYRDSGLKMVVNINYGNPAVSGAVPFPTNMVNYADTLQRIVNYLVSLGNTVAIVIENEELNTNYHTGTLAQYVTMLQTAYPIVHLAGFKMMNGGIGERLNTPCFRWIKSTKYDQTTADLFGHATMLTAEYNGANNPGTVPSLEASVLNVDTIIQAHAYYDFFNYHFYEVYDPNTTGDDTVTQSNLYAQWRVKEYVESVTSKPLVTNETGQRNNEQATLVANQYTKFYQYGYWYSLQFSGDDTNARALQNPDGSLRPGGDAYLSFQNSHTTQ